MNEAFLTPVTAFAGFPWSKTNGVSIREFDGLGIATVLARKGQAQALAARVRERFGLDLPSGPRLGRSGDISFVGTGPNAWLAISRSGGNAFATPLRDAIGDFASIADQGDGLAVLQVSGTRVREALCKLFAVDLDARAFQVGDVAVSPAGHVGATLWRVDDVQRAPSFEIAVHRSFAASFGQHLVEAAQ